MHNPLRKILSSKKGIKKCPHPKMACTKLKKSSQQHLHLEDITKYKVPDRSDIARQQLLIRLLQSPKPNLGFPFFRGTFDDYCPCMPKHERNARCQPRQQRYLTYLATAKKYNEKRIQFVKHYLSQKEEKGQLDQVYAFYGRYLIQKSYTQIERFAKKIEASEAQAQRIKQLKWEWSEIDQQEAQYEVIQDQIKRVNESYAYEPYIQRREIHVCQCERPRECLKQWQNFIEQLARRHQYCQRRVWHFQRVQFSEREKPNSWKKKAYQIFSKASTQEMQAGANLQKQKMQFRRYVMRRAEMQKIRRAQRAEKKAEIKNATELFSENSCSYDSV